MAITSGKGGVGKTTVTANLGVALALTGKRVLLIDTDTGLRNLDIVLGFEDEALYDAIDIVDGVKAAEDVWIQHKIYKSLYMIPASQTKSKEDLSKEGLKALCDELKERFDYILIDCPAGLEYGFQCAMYAADEAIIVTVPDRAAMRDADKVAGIIESEYENIKNKRLLVNRFIPELSDSGVVAGAEEVLFSVSVKLLGIIPEDPKVLINAYKGLLSVTDKRSYAGKAIKNVAERLGGNEVPLIVLKKKRLFRKKYRD